ncbi:GNAT family N-acetyltransferase [Pseudovibrio axinellae]|uniref:GNAT family N-acetyltransferase n=1 Tax=Pseudovibrio axinellae TaxID=989403 RepID=UPI001FCB0593|nr:GNAT family N-acetyltransferase [Pseudovibrio axinellae]
MKFRDITSADMGFLQALYGSTRAIELDRTGWSKAQKDAFIQMQFNAQHSHYQLHYPDALWLIIEQKDVPIGRLYLEYWESQHRIIDIALLPEMRGKGLGTEILLGVMKKAAHDGKAVSIHVEKDNLAMELYKRLGFKRIEDKGVYDLLEWRE